LATILIGIHVLALIDENDKFQGIITQADLLMEIGMQLKGLIFDEIC
jgi:CBS-domain-containing membrane protein